MDKPEGVLGFRRGPWRGGFLPGPQNPRLLAGTERGEERAGEVADINLMVISCLLPVSFCVHEIISSKCWNRAKARTQALE